MNPIKLPTNGYYITFKDGVILYLPNTVIYQRPNQKLMWARYEQAHSIDEGEKIWEVIQSKDNSAQVLEGRAEYRLESKTDITKSKYLDKIANEPFYIDNIKFIVTHINPDGFYADGMK